MNYLGIYKVWKENVKDNEILAELNSIEGKDEQIKERFYKALSFGTAGLRGILGAGINRMNIYTVAQATQGFSDYLNSKSSTPTVAIAYDSRIMSKEFADIAACVFAANGIKVHLFKELMPTPMLSYAVRKLGCTGGVVVTASHNPAEYNGYKAYNENGCQIDGEAASAILNNIGKTDIFSGVKTIALKDALNEKKIEYISDEVTESYMSDQMRLQYRPDVTKNSPLKVVFTPLYGAGYKWVKDIFARMGIENLYIVEEQALPNGNFPTCPYPNPESRDALTLGIELLKKEDADILIATDPDADRIGVATKDEDDILILSGDEVGIMLLNYIAISAKETGKMPSVPAAIKSVVSSKMADVIAKKHGIRLKSVLTGFKNIGDCMDDIEADKDETFLFAYEESCGYLGNNLIRDKDAVNATAIFIEMTAWYQKQNLSLRDALVSLYEEYGYYLSRSVSYAFKGISGEATMKKLMSDLREKPLPMHEKVNVRVFKDYLSSTSVENGVTSTEKLPHTNMVEFILSDGSVLMVRPSGTEPKMKVYYFTYSKDSQGCKDRFKELSDYMGEYISSAE